MRLHVNIDHVATVRQARRTDEPDPVRAAVLAELGGADGITVHLREDRRHIQERDLELLLRTVRTGVNLELAGVDAMLDIAIELRPMIVTLVPERREEVTTEGGLAIDQVTARTQIARAVARLAENDIRTSLFIDPDTAAVEAALEAGADAVELHTGSFAGCWAARHGSAGAQRLTEEVGRLQRAAARARALGLAVHAGHGLTYENVRPVAAIMEIEELNIGHSIVSRAVLVGMERAVREMRSLLTESAVLQGAVVA